MIQFILNNKTVTTEEKTGKTLVDFIRENKQLKGTKIGCREGDCGACTVLVGSLNDNMVTYKSITSCISPLGNVNGKHIVTIEGINLDKKLTTIQNAMAENFATQCGFCTPGFVVSLTGYALNKCSDNNQIDAISGNICRCTGYKSIEKAANEIESKITSRSLEDLIKDGFVPDYFTEIPNRLKELNIKNPKLSISTGNYIANGTDLYVRQADYLSEKTVNLVGEINLLKGITFKNNTCYIGASTTVTEIFENQKLKTIFPNLKKHLKLISSEQIRNMGTLGGNFVNASPIGDMSIFFLALNSTLHLVKNTEREIEFKNFHQDYKKYDLQENELIRAISFKIPSNNTKFNFEKVSKRTHLDIASVNSACSLTIENNSIKNAHFSIGGVAAIPKYLEKTAEFVVNKELSVTTIKDAEKIMQTEISPIADVRGSVKYKRLLARQLFFAHFVELFPNIIARTKDEAISNILK